MQRGEEKNMRKETWGFFIVYVVQTGQGALI